MIVVVLFIVTTTLMPISIASETWAGSSPALQIMNSIIAQKLA